MVMKWILILFTCSMFAQVKVDSVYIFHPDGRFLEKNYQEPVRIKLDSLNEIYKTDSFIMYYFFNDGQVLTSDVRKRKVDLVMPKKEII